MGLGAIFGDKDIRAQKNWGWGFQNRWDTYYIRVLRAARRTFALFCQPDPQFLYNSLAV
jgi:hypothetical protein